MKTTTRNFSALIIAAAMATGFSGIAMADDSAPAKTTSSQSSSSYQASSSSQTAPAPVHHGWFYRLFHGKDAATTQTATESNTTTSAKTETVKPDTTRTDSNPAMMNTDTKADTTMHNDSMNSTSTRSTTTTDQPGSRSSATYNENAATTSTSDGVGVPRTDRPTALSADEKAFRDGGTVGHQ